MNSEPPDPSSGPFIVHRLPSSLLVMVAEIEPAVEFKVWQAIQGGLDMVILRAKDDDLEAIRAALSNLRTAVGNAFPVVVNAGLRTPKLAQASGCHLPEAALAKGLKPSGKGRLLGVSVHSVEAAREAERLGPDYLLAGTVFETRSHPGEKAGGLDPLKAICEATSVPVIAIGGITPANAGDCIRAGAQGVAAMSPFKGAGREATARAYKEAMSGRF